MWKRNVSTKNTFINIDTGVLDDANHDPRKVQSWGMPSVFARQVCSSFDSTSDDESDDIGRFSDSADDWDSNDINRLKTIDPMEFTQGQNENKHFAEHVRNVSMSGFSSDFDDKQCGSILNPLQVSSTLPQSNHFPMQAHGLLWQVAPALDTRASPMMLAWNPTWNLGAIQAGQVSAEMSSAHPQQPMLRTTRTGREHKDGQHALVEEASSTWTCRMLRNVPNDYTRQDLLKLLDSKQIQYDFVYLPCDWEKRANLGYAFVNLSSHAEADRIAVLLNGFSDWTVPSEKKCQVVWGTAQRQNLHRLIELFRNSPVMHPDVPEEFKPMLFKARQHVVFPAPTKRIRSPPSMRHHNAP